MTFARRDFLAGTAAAALAATTKGDAFAAAPATVTLPFQNGTRPLVAYPAEAVADRFDAAAAAARNPVRGL